MIKVESSTFRLLKVTSFVLIQGLCELYFMNRKYKLILTTKQMILLYSFDEYSPETFENLMEKT